MTSAQIYRLSDTEVSLSAGSEAWARQVEKVIAEHRLPALVPKRA
jgi:hypothetical protein